VSKRSASDAPSTLQIVAASQPIVEPSASSSFGPASSIVVESTRRCATTSWARWAFSALRRAVTSVASTTRARRPANVSSWETISTSMIEPSFLR
jgi:hypothetical protein